MDSNIYNCIKLLKKLSFDLLANKVINQHNFINNPYILISKSKEIQENNSEQLELLISNNVDNNNKSCLICSSSISSSLSNNEKETCLLKEWNILQNILDDDDQGVCEDCSNLVDGIEKLQKHVEQIQDRINRVTLSLKTIVRIAYPKSKSNFDYKMYLINENVQNFI